ncbi:MAG: 5-formyltetrahydrofolate cyclo-ligase [Taibaiella sp.]|nr:5-formyltetrahydrofolate cyclo-ligase [Taibaiella sp.]
MLKDEIRKVFKEKRKSLSADQTSRLIQKMSRHFDAWLPSHIPQAVMSFVPFRKFAEIDPGAFEASIRSVNPEVILAYPRVRDGHIFPVLPDSSREAVSNPYGIFEYPGTPVDPAALDLVLLPLLAADRSGHRVGYGKGYYDRLLATLSPGCMTIGLSYFPLIDAIDDVSPWDQTLSACLTPDHLHCFDKT